MNLLVQLSRIILSLVEGHLDGFLFDSGAHECSTGQLDSSSEIRISPSDMHYSGHLKLTSSRHQRYPCHFLGHFRVRHHPWETHPPIL